MKNKDLLDYNAYYESILSTKDSEERLYASDFVNYFSELIIKHSPTVYGKLKM